MYNLIASDGFQFSSPGEVYALDAQRMQAGLATITSDQRLSLLDPARLSQGPVQSHRTEHGNLGSLRIFDAATSAVCTTGDSGEVAVWDLRGGGKVAQFQAANQVPILSMACSPASHTIAVGTELQNHTASIHLWDIRTTPSPKATYTEVHSDDITTLTFHPSTPPILLSGSTDGLVNIYDTRIADEDDLTIQTFNHNASVHCASFLSDTEVVALSHDEQFALYDVDMTGETAGRRGDATRDWGDLREVVGCQYVADVVLKADGSGAVVGVGAQDRQTFELLFLSKGPAWELGHDDSVGLLGAHGGEIVRSFCFYDEAQVVFTAGEDGMVKAWRPGG